MHKSLYRTTFEGAELKTRRLAGYELESEDEERINSRVSIKRKAEETLARLLFGD